jgi:hypothetical protein
VQGVLWGQTSAPLAANAQAGQVGQIWVPIYQIAQTVVPTSGVVPGAGGHVGALILTGSGNPEVAGGSGEMGSIAYVEQAGLQFSTSLNHDLRAIQLMAVAKYGVALRAQNLIVGMLYDDA